MIAPAGLVPAGVFYGGSKTFSGSVTYIYLKKGSRKSGGLDFEAEGESRRYLMKKKINGKVIAAIIVGLAVVGIAVYLIISISKQVVNIDISGYNEVSITSGGTGKTITPSEEQRTQISSLVKNMNLKAKKFPETKGWAYRITYYKESYDKLKEYIDTLYK